MKETILSRWSAHHRDRAALPPHDRLAHRAEHDLREAMTATIAHDEHARVAARVQQGVSGVVEHDIRFDHEVGIVLGEPGNGLRDDEAILVTGLSWPEEGDTRARPRLWSHPREDDRQWLLETIRFFGGEGDSRIRCLRTVDPHDDSVSGAFLVVWNDHNRAGCGSCDAGGTVTRRVLGLPVRPVRADHQQVGGVGCRYQLGHGRSDAHNRAQPQPGVVLSGEGLEVVQLLLGLEQRGLDELGRRGSPADIDDVHELHLGIERECAFDRPRESGVGGCGAADTYGDSGHGAMVRRRPAARQGHRSRPTSAGGYR